MKEISKSNIIPMSKNSSEQQYEMITFHTTPRKIVIRSAEIVDNQPTLIKNKPLDLPKFNTSAKNSSLLSFSGALILTVDFIFIACFTIGTRSNLVTMEQSVLFFHIHLLCSPIVFPMIYFLKKPKYLVVVLKDLNLL